MFHDILYIGSEVFLHIVDKTLKCSSCVVLGSYQYGEGLNKEILFEAIDKVLTPAYNFEGLWEEEFENIFMVPAKSSDPGPANVVGKEKSDPCQDQGKVISSVLRIIRD